MTDPRAKRAYYLYVIKARTLEETSRAIGASHRTVRRLVVEQGGQMRGRNTRGLKKKPQVGPGQTGWRKEAKCSIGYSNSFSTGGSWYCGQHCEHGRCDDEATAQDLEAFARLGEKRRRLDARDKARTRSLVLAAEKRQVERDMERRRGEGE